MTRSLATALLVSFANVAPMASVATGQPTATRPDTQAIQTLLADRIDQGRGVGLVVCIVTPDDTDIVSRGVTHRGDTTPVGGATRFEIGSLTKVFTALLLSDLARTGEIDLDAPLSELLGVEVTSPGMGKITARQLATHTSGLPFWPDNFPADRAGDYQHYTTDNLADFLKRHAPAFAPGEKWGYSNLNGALLGASLAGVAGTDYDTLLSRRVTEPLVMTRTGRNADVNRPRPRRPRPPRRTLSARPRCRGCRLARGRQLDGDPADGPAAAAPGRERHRLLSGGESGDDHCLQRRRRGARFEPDPVVASRPLRSEPL